MFINSIYKTYISPKHILHSSIVKYTWKIIYNIYIQHKIRIKGESVIHTY